MGFSRQDKGRSLFPFGSNGTTHDSQAAAFSLLRAVSFTQRGPKSHRVIAWGETQLATRLFQCPADNLPRTESELIELILPENQRARQNAIASLKSDGDAYTLTYAINVDEFEPLIVRESGQRLKGEGDLASYITCVIQDVSELEKSKARIERDYQFGVLPGCLNADFFDQILSHQQAAGQKPQIIRVKLENQTDLFDVYGPFALDYVVTAIAKRISGELSAVDYIAFDRDQHFQILLSRATPSVMLAKSKKLKYILGQIPIESPYGAMALDCNIAIETPADVMSESERAEMGVSSRAVSVSLNKPIREVDILIALEQDRFRLAYQPIKTSIERLTVYYEGLLRYQDDSGEMISAFPYILAAEKFGLVGKLDRRALSLARRALTLKPDVKLALNVSVGTLSDINTAEHYISDLKSLGEAASNVMIEMTETMALDTLEKANAFSAKIQALGCQFAVDDFGAGHTSFQNLLGLEAQIIKIDGSYIRDIALSKKKQNFVRMIAEMAHVFGMKTVAEMIDNENDAKMVQRLGVDYMQGFWLGMPDTEFPNP